jgi:hypothetical protein
MGVRANGSSEESRKQEGNAAEEGWQEEGREEEGRSQEGHAPQEGHVGLSKPVRVSKACKGFETLIP